VLQLAGELLHTYLSRTGPVAPNIIKLVMWQLLDAVIYLHNHDPSLVIIHRDLKPGNILLLPDIYNVKLIDFNGAAVVERSQPGSSEAGSSSSSSNSNSHSSSQALQVVATHSLPLRSLFGSELYMAPELTALFDADEAGGAEAAVVLPGYNEKVDVYALGAIAMVMAAGGQGRLKELMVPPAGVGRNQHLEGLVSRFTAGQLLVGNMTVENMHKYEGLRQFVKVCCTRDPSQRPSAADLERPSVQPVCAWLHDNQ
jgi:serine/threonine protein kinase